MNPQEPNILATTDTPKPGEYGIVVRVADSLMGTFTMPTPRTTTYADCELPGKVRTQDPVIAAMVFLFNAGGGDGYHSFYFATPRTGGAELVAFESYTEVDPSVYWPPVLTALPYYLRQDLSYVFKPTFKGPYSGPTQVLVEEFFSHTPHSITVATQMRPEPYEGVLEITGATAGSGAKYEYNMGSLELRSCLRGLYTFVLPSPSFTVGGVTYSDCTMVVPATNVSDWPATVVIDDRQRKVGGGYLRRRVTASKPY